MKATTILSFALILSLGFTLAPMVSRASEVTGQLSSAGSFAPPSGSGSEVGGTFGGGSSSGSSVGGGGGGGGSGSLSGTVSGGSSGGGSGGSGGTVLGASTLNNTSEGGTVGEVLGAFTGVPTFMSQNQDEVIAPEVQGELALNTTDGPITVNDGSLTAAVAASGIQLAWWFWLLLLLLLIAVGVYTYRRYQRENK